MGVRGARPLARPRARMSACILTLAIDGMTCATCVSRVERVLKADPDVASASVNLVTNRAEVVLSGAVPTERLIARVAKAGYGAHLVTADEKDANAAEAARLWRRGCGGTHGSRWR